LRWWAKKTVLENTCDVWLAPKGIYSTLGTLCFVLFLTREWNLYQCFRWAWGKLLNIFIPGTLSTCFRMLTNTALCC
jgi:hypothetical protein